MKKLIIAISSIVVFVLLAGLGAYAVVQNTRLNQAQLRLENAYRADLQQAITGMRGVESDISKLMISSSQQTLTQLLSSVSLESAACSQALSGLPIVATGVQNTLKFNNQLSSYCVTQLHSLAYDGTVDDNFSKQVKEFFTTCQDVNRQLSYLEDDVLSGKISLLTVNTDAQPETEGIFGSIADDITEYPSVIFDGPFSDGQAGNTPKEDREIVSSQYASEFIDSLGFLLDYSDEVNGVLPCYSFKSETVSAMVTKKGGLLLSLINNRAVENAEILPEHAKAAAEDFCKKLKLGQDCRIVWQEQYDNSIVFNFAPVKENVTMYPDLFKIKVALDNGEIVGFEGKSYIINNTSREKLYASVSADDALKTLKNGFSAETTRLCVIEVNEHEELCWEFYGTYEGMNYAVYVSADNAVERASFRIIKTETGQMVI